MAKVTITRHIRFPDDYQALPGAKATIIRHVKETEESWEKWWVRFDDGVEQYVFKEDIE